MCVPNPQLQNTHDVAAILLNHWSIVEAVAFSLKKYAGAGGLLMSKKVVWAYFLSQRTRKGEKKGLILIAY